MKKLLFVVGASFALSSCEKENVLNSNTSAKTESAILEDEAEFEKPRVSFKHGIGCHSPLGICISAPISLTGSTDESSLAKTSSEEDEGMVRMRMEGNKMHIIFDRNAALPNGIVPISRDLLFENWKGGKSAVVKAGNYKISFKRYQYGEIWANAYTFK